MVASERSSLKQLPLARVAKKKRIKRPRASRNCQHFAGLLAGCARGGLTALPVAHQALIVGGDKVVCSINLDTCRQPAEPDAPRWDYVLVIHKGDGPGIAMEVHHAAASEVPAMLNKKAWAAALLGTACESLQISRWAWLVPHGQQPLFTPNDPSAKALSQAGIEFPKAALAIP